MLNAIHNRNPEMDTTQSKGDEGTQPVPHTYRNRPGVLQAINAQPQNEPRCWNWILFAGLSLLKKTSIANLSAKFASP